MLDIKGHQELDLVELLVDLPQFDVQKGEIGVVVEVFETPDEAYDLEFVDRTGGPSRFAYSVRPSQIRSAEETAKEAFEHGLELVRNRKFLEAETEFHRAIDLKPASIVNLHNLILKSYDDPSQLEDLIEGLRMVLRLDPSYEIDEFNMGAFARSNLAMAYQNCGVKIAKDGDIRTAIKYFELALGVGPNAEMVSLIRRNLVKAYTSLGIQAVQSDSFDDLIGWMGKACEIEPTEMTRRNLGSAYGLLAKSLLDRRDFGAAVSALQYAIDIGLSSPELLNDYGIALAHIGHRDEAIGHLRRAADLSPDNRTIQENLILVEDGAVEGFNAIELPFGFGSAQPMEQHAYEYQPAA